MDGLYILFIVVTRQVAELAGGDEDLFKNWNRMELGAVSIALECPGSVKVLIFGL
jgi:hypothetical protein